MSVDRPFILAFVDGWEAADFATITELIDAAACFIVDDAEDRAMLAEIVRKMIVRQIGMGIDRGHFDFAYDARVTPLLSLREFRSDLKKAVETADRVAPRKPLPK